MLLPNIIKKGVIIFKNKRIFIIVLTILFLLFILSYSFSDVLFRLANSAVDTISEKTGIKLGKTLYDFESAVNIFRPKKDLWVGDLPIFQFKLSANDIKHFDEISKKAVQQGYMDKESNTWRSIKLKYKDKTYDAEIKLHGDQPVHWENELKSYNAKLLNNESINNLKKFNLIIFEERLLDSKIADMLSNEFGLFDIRDDFVVLKINGVPQGLYYLMESLDANFLEYNKCSSCEIIKIRDNKFKDHPEAKKSDNSDLNSFRPYGLDYFSGHLTPFDYELSHVDLEKSDLDLKKTLNAVNGLFQAVKEEDTARLINFFDIDQIASFEALRMLPGHGRIDGDNLKLVYSATNSKFYPMQFEGGTLVLEVDKGGFERFLNTYSTYGFSNTDSPYDSNIETKLFALLNKNDQIRQLKYKKVYQYILNNRDLFLDKIDKVVDEILPYANANKGVVTGTKPQEVSLKDCRPLFEHNMGVIKDALEYATCYINVVEKENKITLEIIPDSISQLRFDSFKIKLLSDNEYSGRITLEYKDENGLTVKSMDIEEKTDLIDLTGIVKDFYFMTGLDEDLGTKKRVYNIIVTFQDADKILIDNIQTKMMNDITGKPLNDDEVYLQIADANDDYSTLIFSSPEEFMGAYDEFNWVNQNGVLTLLKGSYTVNRDVIIPKGLISWNIEPGVQILIDDDKSIVSYSPLNIKGTETEPVVIKALNPDKPFGVFAVVGEKGFKTNIDWLKLSDGNEKFINGLYLSGQLSLYHTDVDIKNSILSGSHSDDGINIKYGKIMVDNCLFTNNFGDQFDGDYVEGVVKNSRFIESDPDADDNGDGLDFSGSRVIVKNNLFKGFKDKGLSIGEETKPIVVYDNTFESSNLGAAVKDSSYAFFIKNKFKNNNVAVSAYQKKEIYSGGGDVYSYENEFESNTDIYKLDGKSSQKDLVFDEAVYTNIIGSIINEDLESLSQTLDPYAKK